MSPDRRQHRGAHPADEELFDEGKIETLRLATSQLAWLISRGYAMNSSLKIVGDRHNLKERQRLAVSRAACSDEQKEKRSASCISLTDVANRELLIDGFNIIITIEAALSGAVLIRCRDGSLRDLSSVHGSYRSVRETERAICLIGEALADHGAGAAKWLLDRPVSNSGRLAQTINRLARERAWNWVVEVIANPDAVIISSGKTAVTSDSLILDRAPEWVDLGSHIAGKYLPQAWVIDLGD